MGLDRLGREAWRYPDGREDLSMRCEFRDP